MNLFYEVICNRCLPYPWWDGVGPGVPLRVHRPRLLPHVEGVVVLPRGRVVQGGVVEVSAEVVLEDAGVLLEGVAVQVGVLREVRRRRRTVEGISRKVFSQI